VSGAGAAVAFLYGCCFVVTCFFLYNQRSQRPRLPFLSGHLFPLPALRLRFCTAVVLLLLVTCYLESSIKSALCRRVEDTSGLCSG
jgi:hypothetical protein